MHHHETVETEAFGVVPVRPRVCPLCGRDNAAVPAGAYSLGPWRMKQCGGCGFTYLDSAPLHDVQVEAMAWQRTFAVEARRRATLRPLSSRLSKAARLRWRLPRQSMVAAITARIPGGNVLDLGCGTGGTLARLPGSFTPYGVEIAAGAATVADAALRARGGHVVNAPGLKGLRGFADGFFAAAALSSYLEHEDEPLAVLNDLRRVLRPRGFAVVKVPNFGSLNRRVMGATWCGFRYPDHLNQFTPKTLAAMATRAGFSTHFPLTGRLPTSDNMWAVLHRDA